MQVFISYKREDTSFAQRLSDLIRQWKFTPWIDTQNIQPGEKWDDAVYRGLRTSSVVVGTITPESVASQEVLNEWSFALITNKPLLLLWLRDVPEENIHYRYSRIQRIDLRKNESQGLDKLKSILEGLTKRPREDEEKSPPFNDPNRERMLQKVHEFWVKGVLENALQENPLIDLELKPYSVLQHADYGNYTLPNTAQIIDMFEAVDRELLILGSPGSGKTITLLQLARDLIDRAKQDKQQPIPVMFNLSSWGQKHGSFREWLLERLWIEYRIPNRTRIDWVDNPKLLLLLDGLDEVPEKYRDECVSAINTFRREYSFVRIAVCSRIADYEKLSCQLELKSAVVLEALTEHQIEMYVKGEELEGLRATLQTDTILKGMARMPFLLNTMTFAYRGMSIPALSGYFTEEARRDHLFDHYVERRFRLTAEYRLAQTRHWLSWLAKKMVEYGQTVFYIEAIQPNWLSGKLRQSIYRFGIGIIIWFVVGIPVWLTIDSMGWIARDWYGVFNGALFGVVGALIVWSTAERRFDLTHCMAIALSFGVALGLGFGRFFGSTTGVFLGVIGGIAGGLCFRLIVGQLLGQSDAQLGEIQIAETLGWSFKRAFLGLIGGLASGLLIGILAAWTIGQFGYFHPFDFMDEGLALGKVVGFGVGLLAALILGVTVDQVNIRMFPNQGIRYSTINAIRLALTGGFLAILIFHIPIEMNNYYSTGMDLSGLTLTCSFAAGLIFGGLASVQHGILRFILYRDGTIPMNYARFLDFAANQFLLRKVGGGYIFQHRYLLEYFASRKVKIISGKQ